MGNLFLLHLDNQGNTIPQCSLSILNEPYNSPDAIPRFSCLKEIKFITCFSQKKPVFVSYQASTFKQFLIGKVNGNEMAILRTVPINLFDVGKMLISDFTIWLVDRNGKIIKILLSDLAEYLGLQCRELSKSDLQEAKSKEYFGPYTAQKVKAELLKIGDTENSDLVQHFEIQESPKK